MSENKMPGISDAALAAEKRAIDARAKWGDYNSLHEAYAVLAEEVDELWDIVKQRQTIGHATDGNTISKVRSVHLIRAEALDIAAVALRIAADAQRMAER